MSSAALASSGPDRALLALPEAIDPLALSRNENPFPPLPAVRSALVTLGEKGLVATSTTAEQYVASPPMVALGALVRERQDDLARARSELEVLTEQYRGAAAQRTVTDVIDVVTGAEAVAQRFAQLQRSARAEVHALIREGVAVVSAEQNVEEDRAAERGVAYHVVLERAVLEQPGVYDNAEEAMARGEQIRVAEQLPLRMMIAVRELVLIPLAPAAEEGQGPAGALLVHPSGLLDGLLGLFDHCWASGRPLGKVASAGAERDGLDETDQRVLSLLLSGLTDQAVGSQLGLSLRTVQRRVATLMDACGVHTRIQLGLQAHKRGWVS